MQPGEFFTTLLHRLFQRAPVTEHGAARIAARRTQGEETETIATAAAALDSAELDDVDE